MLNKNDKHNYDLFRSIIKKETRPPIEFKTPRIEEEQARQSACVRWFRVQYPKFAKVLFAIPNGGKRSKATAVKLKADGVVAGVADLCLAVPRGGYGALYIEMKQKGNYQQPIQKEWQAECERAGNKYVVCHNIKEFMREVNAYLYLPSPKQIQKERDDYRRILETLHWKF